MENKYKKLLQNSINEETNFFKVGRAVVSLRTSLILSIQNAKKLASLDKNLKSQMKKMEKNLDKMIENIEDI